MRTIRVLSVLALAALGAMFLPTTTVSVTANATMVRASTLTPAGAAAGRQATSAMPVSAVVAAPPGPVELVNGGICTALAAPSACLPLGAPSTLDAGAPPGAGDTNLLNASNALGTDDNVIEPSDFNSAVTLSAGQLHQLDGSAPSLSSLIVVAFVPNIAPVTFHATEGLWYESCTSIACDTAAADYLCDGLPGPNPAAPDADPDCGGPNVSAVAPYGPDHVVAAALLCTLAACPVLGPQSITVEQAGFITPVSFTVVGEPVSVQMFRLESAIQAGVPVAGTLSNRGALSCAAPGCTSVPAVCPLTITLAGLTNSASQAEKALIIARALDANGTSIAGAWFDWTVDNNGVPTDPLGFSSDGVVPTNFDAAGMLSAPVAPTINMGSFGVGAPNVLCAPENAGSGSITVRATLARVIPGDTVVDPAADPAANQGLAFGEATFSVHDLPTVMNLSVDPQVLNCDGASPVTISAALTDATGAPAISGTAVHFAITETRAGGGAPTATSVDAMTDARGYATAVVTPSSLATGISVFASSLGASGSTNVVCQTPTATATPSPTNTAMPTATSTPSPSRCAPFGQRLSLIIGILRRLGARVGEPRYQQRYDLNDDGVIDMQDLRLAFDRVACGNHGRH